MSMHRPLVFIYHPEVQEIFNNFTSLFQIRIAYYSPDGKELKVGLNKGWCSYCSLVRGDLGDDALCEECDSTHREIARQKRELVHYRCHAGLEEAVKPLYCDDSLMGFIMIGQMRVAAEAPADKISRWRRKHGAGRLKESFAEVPFVSTSLYPHLLGLFSTLVDLILSRHMISIRGRTLLDPLLDRMREDCSRKLSLSEAAAFLGRSSYHLAHLLKRHYGRTFKQLQTAICLEHADELFSRVPDIAVKEVATRCGFDDPLYFSRVYRRHRGHPPSAMHVAEKKTGKDRRTAILSGLETRI
jgi:AraC-like DNA-binding protein/ligand-binding sensor protein